MTSDTATAFGGGNTVFRRQVVNGRGGGRRVHGVDFGGFQPDAQHQNYHRSRVVHPSQRPRQTEWTPIVTPDDAAATVVVRDPTAARQRHAVAYVTLPTTASTVVATNPVTANGVYGDGSRRPYGYGDDIYYYQHVDTDYSKNRYSQNSVNGGDQTDQARANNQNDMSLVSKTSRNYRNTYAIAGEEKNVSSSHAADVKHDEPLRISYYYPGFENDQRHLRVVSKTHSVDGQMSKQENQNLNIDVATKSHYGDYQNGNAEAVVYENNSERPRNNNDLNFDGDRGHDLAVVAEYDQRPRTHDTVDGENQRRPNRDEKPVEMKNNSTDNSYGRNAVEEGNVSVDADSSSDDHTRHEEREQRQPSAVGHVTAAERPLASVDGLVRNRLGQNLYAHVDATDKNERRYGEGNGKNNYYYYSYDGRENDVKSYDADESIVQNHRESMTPLSVQRKEIERLHRPSTTAAAAEMTVTTTARPRQRRRKVQSSVRQTRRPSVDDQNAVRNVSTLKITMNFFFSIKNYFQKLLIQRDGPAYLNKI